MTLAHSDEPTDMLSFPTRLKIKFLPPTTMQLPIQTMNPSSTSNESMMPSLFQIAAQIEDFIPGQTPFPELLQHAERLAAVLKQAVTIHSVTAAPEKPANIKRATRPSASKNRKPADKNPEPPSGDEPAKIKFYLKAPTARSVKLAADFTQWEKSALEMAKVENDTWFAAVPLTPGRYSYRFIVDGQWCDDPQSARRVPNPFGSANAVIEIT
jgi:hypothetical protein